MSPILSPLNGSARAASSDAAATERLLRAVVTASRELLAADMDAGLRGALRALGEGTGLDRVYAVRFDHATQAGFFVAEHCAPGIASATAVMGAGPYGYAEYEEVWRPLLAGETYSSPTREKTGANAELNEALGTKSDLFVPVIAGGVFWGALGFDDCTTERVYCEAEIQVLRAAAAALAAALTRGEAQAMLRASERARAEEAERRAERSGRHSRLLAAVAWSAEELLAAADVAGCIDAVLAEIGGATAADRACLARLDLTEADPQHHGWQEIVNEWTKPGAARQMDSEARRFAMRRDDGTWARIFSQFAAEGRIVARIDEIDEPARSEQRALGIVWTLCYPVRIEGVLWGLLGFDYATPAEDYDEPDLSALKAVATAIATALLRERRERHRLALERARADEALALNHLLEGVVAASRALLDEPDFQSGLERWLAALAEAVDADRAIVGQFVAPDDPAHVAINQAGWTKPGLPEVFHMPVPASSDFLAWADRLQRGESVWAHRDELNDARSVRYWEETDCFTNLIVPVVVERRTVAWLCFDWRARREWKPAYGTLLRTAADGAAAAIKRNEAIGARLSLERTRAEEALALNHLLEGVVAASRALLDEPDFQSGLERWLAALAEAVDADRAVLGQFAAPNDPAHVAINQINWTKPDGRGDVLKPVPATSDFLAWTERLQRGESIWAHRDELADPRSVLYWEEKNCFTKLFVPVVVDRRTVAWLCFDWRARREWKPAYGALLRTAADGASAAIKRNEAVRAMLAEREGRAADLAAVNRELEQRNRLLAAAARASALLSAREDFDAAVAEAMGLVAEAAEFDRIVLVEHLDAHGNPGVEFWRVTHEWHRPGVMAQQESAVSGGSFADAPMFISELLINERVLEFTTPEIPDEGFRRVQETLGARLLVAGNIFIDGFSWGAFACDDCRTERRRTAEEKGVIAAAARAVGQAIYRRRLEERADALQLQIVTEREAAARERVAEFARANEALRRSAANLTTLTDLPVYLESLLLSAAEISGARTANIFAYDECSMDLTMIAAVIAGRVTSIPDEPRMAPWRRAVPPAISRPWIENMRGKEFYAIEIDRLPEGSSQQFNVAWHIAEGHRLLVGLPLVVGGQLVGLLGLCFTTTVRADTFALEQVRGLAQQAALAVQLARLAENGRQAAVQAERNRIARDLHDTLAQGFTGVLAQLGAAEGAVETGRLGEMNNYLERAKALARFSLAEARSSVHALRPEANPAPLVARLRQMLAGMTQGTALDAAVEETGEPGRLGLAADWCVHKFAQETLANAVKHAGARTFRVEVAWGAEFSVCAWDDGRGFDPATTPPGLGLLTMRERAAEASGTITNQSRPGHGTRLCLTFTRQHFSPSPDAKTP